jgi:hypothetical protein
VFDVNVHAAGHARTLTLMVSTVGWGVGGTFRQFAVTPSPLALSPFPPDGDASSNQLAIRKPKPLWYIVIVCAEMEIYTKPRSQPLTPSVSRLNNRVEYTPHCTLAPGAHLDTCPHHERPQAYMKSVHVRPSLAPPHVVSVRGTGWQGSASRALVSALVLVALAPLMLDAICSRV